jgi:hypothetical protein
LFITSYGLWADDADTEDGRYNAGSFELTTPGLDFKPAASAV